MAHKFNSKKSWHPPRLQNVEKVWIAEQKNLAEQRKLQELRKQIREERERTDQFRQLQERAGLVLKQERVEFLYDSGLSVGYGGSSGVVFKALECVADSRAASSSQLPQNRYVQGALFEGKEPSASDAWRKLHSDPLLLIRQKEQEALARVKNNPIQMAMIRKSVKDAKDKERVYYKDDDKKSRKKHREKKHSSRRNHSDFETSASQVKERRKGSEGHRESGSTSKEETSKGFYYDSSNTTRKRRHKLSDEERAAKLREMQIDAELHEEQRWKRLKKAEETNEKEALYTNPSGGRSFLDAVQKRAYGTSNEGSSTIEDSVRRRTYYLQGKSEATEKNAFRRI